MPIRRGLSLIVAVCCLTGGGPMRFGAFAGQSAMSQPAELPTGQLNLCEQAGTAAEQANGLPPGLLLAIGRVESGKWDSARKRVTGWPWTINAAGKGQWFDTKEIATETVRTLLGGGMRSIDVGCFQINLLYHPTAFTSLEQAFDPDANARYAARFLLGLFSQTGSWEAAVEAYHSADPALGFPYRQQVFAAWPATAPVVATAGSSTAGASIAGGVGSMTGVASLAKPIAMPTVIAGVRIWSPMPVGTASAVVVMPGSAAPDPASAPMGGDGMPLPAVSYRIPAGILPPR